MRKTLTRKFDFDGKTISSDEFKQLIEAWGAAEGDIEITIDQQNGPGDYGGLYTHTTITITEQ